MKESEFFLMHVIWVDALEFNTQGLSEEAINELVYKADSCMVVLADWDARGVWS